MDIISVLKTESENLRSFSFGVCSNLIFVQLGISRSYKHYPKVIQEKTTKLDKKFFNKTIRYLDDDVVYKGSQCKKLAINWNTWRYH